MSVEEASRGCRAKGMNAPAARVSPAMRTLLWLATLLGLLGAATSAHAWSRRWRHAEATLGSDPELSAARVTLFADLVLVSEPFVPSHCSEMRVHEGRVVAFDRETGALRWTRRVPQTTGDQLAYLRAHVLDDVVVFETWSRMVAFDARGRRVWSRDRVRAECRGGIMVGFMGEVRRRGAHLEWAGDGATCRLRLRTGRVERAPSRAPRGRVVPVSTFTHPDAGGWVLGSAADERGVAALRVRSTASGVRARVVFRPREARR